MAGHVTRNCLSAETICNTWLTTTVRRLSKTLSGNKTHDECNRIAYRLACVASVSVRLSPRSRHFSLFWLRENWGERKKVLLLSVLRSPNFCAAKKRKTSRTDGKPYGNACYQGYIQALEICLPRRTINHLIGP